MTKRYVIDALYPTHPMQDWPHGMPGIVSCEVEDIMPDPDHIIYRLVVLPEQLDYVRGRIEKLSVEYSIIGMTDPPPAPPEPMFTTMAQASGYMSRKYGERCEGKWTAQEGADYFWVRYDQKQPHRIWKSGPEVLQEAWAWRVYRHSRWPDLQQGEAADRALYNAVRLRYGQYPIDEHNHEVFEIEPLS